MPKVKTYLSPNVIAIDLAHNMAAIPGDGNVPVTFTYTFDIAHFLVAAISCRGAFLSRRFLVAALSCCGAGSRDVARDDEGGG